MNGKRLMCATLAAILWVGAAHAALTDGTRRAKPLRASGVDYSAKIDINNISMFVTNTGSFAYDKQNSVSGLEFPRGTGKTAVYAAGLWIGAQVGGKIRLAVSEYGDEYGPGAVIGSGAGAVPDDPGKAEYKVYKLNRKFDKGHGMDQVNALADYNAGAVIHGAPVVTMNPDSTLNIVGDQMMWAVYNDLNRANHVNRAAKTLPLGVEVQQTTFAFSLQGALGNTVFMRYKIYNRGANTLNNMYVSQWSDPDLGGAADDLVGCDTTLSLGFVYNATNNDELYFSQPPAVGFDFLQGPKVAGVPLGLASFNKYINGTDPNDSTKTYNYMLGLDAAGATIINPTNGQPTKFQVSGDPVTGAGWLDTAPADRRLMLSSGPFTMAPGDSQEVVVGIVVGQSSNRLSSISLMKFYDTFVQAAYDAGFNLPRPPSDPVVTATPRDGSIFLSWDSNAEIYNQPPYDFQGYVVYQGASIAGPFTRIATYDKADGITTVIDDDFNEEQGLILPIGKAFGQDVGVRYQIEVNQDAVRGGPLYNNSTYYYAVTAYAVDVNSFPKVLESPFQVLAVTPQTPPAGVDWSSAGLGPVTQSQRTPGPIPTTDVVETSVVDPDKVVTADWEIGFKPDGASRVWYLVRRQGTAVDTVVNNWPNFSGDDTYPVVDGIQVKLTSKPPGVLSQVIWSDTTGGNPTPVEGVDFGLEYFGGGGGYAADQVGSTIASQSVGPDVTVRFGVPTDIGEAYHYKRQPLSSGTIYGYIDKVPVPFAAYNSANPATRYAVGFLESEGAASDDNAWMPSSAGNGGREIIFIFNRSYSDPTNDAYFADPSRSDLLSGALPIYYEFIGRRFSDTDVIDTGDKLLFVTSIPSNANDQFTFSTTAPDRLNSSLAKGQLDLVRAVPNPYFSHSTYEVPLNPRVLKFTHLPARCTVRLFNLAGDRVATLEKNDGSSELSWNLNTDNGLPVGSGVYIFHVDAPGIGTHIGKVAIFMEKERLSRF